MNLDFPKRDPVVTDLPKKIYQTSKTYSRAADTSFLNGFLTNSISKKRSFDNTSSPMPRYDINKRYARSKSQIQFKINMAQLVTGNHERSKYLIESAHKSTNDFGLAKFNANRSCSHIST